ncbi:MAG: DUF3046 domain-containing protein [Antricoccus sp.]
MRLSDFFERMDSHFGHAYARSVAADFVMSELGERTVDEAIEAGVDTKVIWRAICNSFEIPQTLH